MLKTGNFKMYLWMFFSLLFNFIKIWDCVCGLSFLVKDLLKKIIKKTMSRRADDFLMKTTGRTFGRTS